ncbi:MAG: AAA family ATPase [Bacteroidales bacterium]|nr:AAA family ATPase [Bacteroidales bacterium]
MSLYLKYRPKDFNEIKGNQDAIKALDTMLSGKDIPHAFLLHGQTGCGKTSTARIIADKLECKGKDLVEVDSGQFRGIDTIRDIRSNSQYLPIEGKCRVWIIDEVHRLTSDAQSGLLKILEDAPKHVYFILCTTDPQKLLPTIKGRCIQIQMNPLSERQMFALLSSIVKSENQTLASDIYDQIVQDSLGLPRNAINILEQVLSVPEDRRLIIAKQTAEHQSQIIELCRALIGNASWSKVKSILTGLKEQEAETIRRAVLGYCQAVLLNKENDMAALIIEKFWEPTYNIGFPGIVYACYSIIKN